MAMLQATLAEVVDEGVARAVLVTAPPGTGKSRLRSEVVRRIARENHDVGVWQAAGDPMSAGSSFAILGALVRHAAGVREGVEAEARRRALASRVRDTVAPAEAARVTAFLGELAGIPFPDEDDATLRAARLDAPLMADHTLRAWQDWIRAEGAARPLVLVLDDLHWGDAPSVRYLESIVRNLADAPVLIFALARPEVEETFPDLWKLRTVQRYQLPDLPRRAAERLARELLGDVDEERVRRVVELAAGNAFYLEELIRAVAEGHDAAGLPESVLAMAQARFEALDDEAREHLRAASVVGEVFWEGAVARLLGRSEFEIASVIERLVAGELLVRRGEGRFFGQRELRFRHALLHEAAYAAVSDGERRAGHGAAAAWLSSVGEHDAMTLAEHLRRAGRTAEAATHFHRATEQALEAGDLHAVSERARAAVECGLEGEALILLRMLGIEALKWQGRLGETLSAAADLRAVVPEESQVWWRLTAELLVLGRDTPALRETLGRLRFDAPIDPAIVIPLCRVATAACIQMVPATELMAALERADDGDPGRKGWLEQARAFAAAARGDLGEALRRFEAAAEAFRAIGNHRDALAQRIDHAYAMLEVGDYEGIEARLVPMLAEVGNFMRLTTLKLILAMARACQGQDQRQHAREILAGMDSAVKRGVLANAYMAWVELLAGDLEAAEITARQAVAAVRHVYDARPVLAWVLLERGRVEEAAALMEPPMFGDGVMSRPLAGKLPDAAMRLAAYHRAGRAETPSAARAAWELLCARWRVLCEPELRATFRRMYDVQLILEIAPQHGIDVSEVS
jgi:hypothetical protein